MKIVPVYRLWVSCDVGGFGREPANIYSFRTDMSVYSPLPIPL